MMKKQTKNYSLMVENHTISPNHKFLYSSQPGRELYLDDLDITVHCGSSIPISRSRFHIGDLLGTIGTLLPVLPSFYMFPTWVPEIRHSTLHSLWYVSTFGS